VFDPERQSALQLQQVSKLQDELISAKMQLAQIRGLSPENPQIPVLQKRVGAIDQEIAAEMAKIAGGGNNSLTNKAADFERLSLERAFADRQLASTMTSLENARNEARRKALYLERIVQPSKPDMAVEPRRLRSIFTVLVMGLIAWGILSMLLAGVREHKD
jgi:capsular polysaccharide transport system permease protein